MQHIWIEIRHASKTNPDDAGEIAEAQFEVVKGEVVVTGMDGRPIGKRKIENGDPEQTAKRVLREGRPKRDFWRRLPLTDRGIY
jgi:hypothetical protein